MVIRHKPSAALEKGKSVDKHCPNAIAQVSMNLSKTVLHVHGVSDHESVLLTKAMSPDKFFE